MSAFTIPENLKIGFLGAGRMAQAIVGGLVKTGVVKPDHVIASGTHPERIKTIQEFGVATTFDNLEVVRNSDITVIAVKPHIVAKVLKEVAPVVTKDKLIISIAAGIPLKTYEDILPKGTRVVRVMPNTPTMVCSGVSAFTLGTNATPEDGKVVNALFSIIGICEEVSEPLLHAVTGTSGSGPAYVYMGIEAMADAGVRAGLPRPVALRVSAQTFMGAAKMVLETGVHPGELKDNVCSPGGTTITAVEALEDSGYRAAIMKAVRASADRSKEMANN